MSMNIYQPTLILLISNSLIYALYYLYVYQKTHSKYLVFWGFSWIIYSLGYLPYLVLGEWEFSSAILYASLIVSGIILFVGTVHFVGSSEAFLAALTTLFIILIVVGGLYRVILSNFSIDLFELIYFLSSFILSMAAAASGIVFLAFGDLLEEEIGNPPMSIVQHITGWGFIFWGLLIGYYAFMTENFYAFPENYVSMIVLINFLNISIIFNITEQNFRKILRGERIYRLLTENARDLIIKGSLEHPHPFLYVSPSAFTMTGYQAEHFMNDPKLFVKILHPEDVALYQRFLQEPTRASSTMVYRIFHRNGYVIWIEQQNAAMPKDESGKPTFEAILRDVTDRKMIEEDLFKTEISRRQLLVNISHELRTPITSIIGYLSAIADRIVEPEEHEKYLRLSLDKSLKLNVLIEDLFELSKMETLQIKFQYEPHNAGKMLSKLVEETISDLSFSCASIERSCHCAAPEENCPLLNADYHRMEQVFRNLAINAIRHLKRNGELVFHCECAQSGCAARFMPDPHGDFVVYSVEDNGCGIAEEDIPHIFDRFFRRKTGGKPEGAGLGLSICKEILRFHGGQIWVESELGKGSIFHMSIPAYKGGTANG